MRPNPPASQLVSELRHLRMMFRESLLAYCSKIEAQISLVIQAVQELPRKPAHPVNRPVNRSKRSKAKSNPETNLLLLSDLHEMLAMVQVLKLRPEKGRRKDLRRVEKLTSDLRARIDNW